ncbi:hypothetical protein ABPG74_000969 [Tetrahymena malaccensis]
MKRAFIFISLLSILSITSVYLISSSSSVYQDLDVSNSPRCFEFVNYLIPQPPVLGQHQEIDVGFFASNICSQKMRFTVISSTKQEITACLKQDQQYLIHIYYNQELKIIEEKC